MKIPFVFLSAMGALSAISAIMLTASVSVAKPIKCDNSLLAADYISYTFGRQIFRGQPVPRELISFPIMAGEMKYTAESGFVTTPVYEGGHNDEPLEKNPTLTKVVNANDLKKILDNESRQESVFRKSFCYGVVFDKRTDYDNDRQVYAPSRIFSIKPVSKNRYQNISLELSPAMFIGEDYRALALKAKLSSNSFRLRDHVFGDNNRDLKEILFEDRDGYKKNRRYLLESPSCDDVKKQIVGKSRLFLTDHHWSDFGDDDQNVSGDYCRFNLELDDQLKILSGNQQGSDGYGCLRSDQIQVVLESPQQAESPRGCYLNLHDSNGARSKILFVSKIDSRGRVYLNSDVPSGAQQRLSVVIEPIQ